MPLANLRYQKQRRDVETLTQHTEAFKIEPRFITRLGQLSTSTRFRDRELMRIQQRMNLLGELVEYGLSGVELVYPNEINEDYLGDIQTISAETSLRIQGIVVDLSSISKFRFGAFTSINHEIRNSAITHLKSAIEICEDVEADYVLLLLNSDGYDTPFGLDLIAARDRFALALAEALDAFSDVRITFQPTPNEQRQRHFFQSTAEITLLCHKVESLLTNPLHLEYLFAGHTLLTVCPNLTYSFLNGEEISNVLSILLENARLTGITIDSLASQYLMSNKTLLNFSSLTGALYLLKMAGYTEHFCIQPQSKHSPTVQDIRNSMDWLRSQIAFVNHLDDDKVILSHLDPQKNIGWLDAYLIRAASPHLAVLPPIDFFEI